MLLENTNSTLIRLKDCENERMIRSFYTENPEHFLALYTLCKEKGISINIPPDYDNENDFYKNKEAGDIEDIEVSFGGNNTFPCIDVWINVY